MNGYFFISDIDECKDNTNDCSKDATCNNTIGSFECTCKPGFTGDGSTCIGTNFQYDVFEQILDIRINYSRFVFYGSLYFGVYLSRSRVK